MFVLDCQDFPFCPSKHHIYNLQYNTLWYCQRCPFPSRWLTHLRWTTHNWICWINLRWSTVCFGGVPVQQIQDMNATGMAKKDRQFVFLKRTSLIDSFEDSAGTLSFFAAWSQLRRKRRLTCDSCDPCFILGERMFKTLVILFGCAQWHGEASRIPSTWFLIKAAQCFKFRSLGDRRRRSSWLGGCWAILSTGVRELCVIARQP